MSAAFCAVTGACVAAVAYGGLAVRAFYAVAGEVRKAAEALQRPNSDLLDGWVVVPPPTVVPTPTDIADGWVELEHV